MSGRQRRRPGRADPAQGAVPGQLAFSRRIIDWFAEKTQKTKTRAEIENGFWGRLVNVVMKRPIAFAAPILILMTLLVIPVGQLALGGLSEKYLPPDNPCPGGPAAVRQPVPTFRTEPLTMVIRSEDGKPVTDDQLAEIRAKAGAIPGFTVPDNNPDKMWRERAVQDGATKGIRRSGSCRTAWSTRATRRARSTHCGPFQAPHGLQILVGGTSALAQDSIHSLFDKLPLMVTILVITTTILMFLAFRFAGSADQAAVMSALTVAPRWAS